jgi:tetratricopeptide (TPR) repeat protein
MSEERTCFICLDSEGDAIQGGCACRGSAGIAHVECRLRLAESKTVLTRHATKVATEWWKCSTCTSHFTGETKRYLSRKLTALSSSHSGNAWLRDVAMHQQIATELAETRFAEAERHARAHHAGLRRTLGDEAKLTLAAADFLATALAKQGKKEEAVIIQRTVLEATRRACGDESGETLNAAGKLAETLTRMRMHTEAERLIRAGIETTTRVFGRSDLHTLAQRHALALCFCSQGKWDQAERIFRDVLHATRRIQGPDHPGVVDLVYNIALTRKNLGDHDEARALLRTVLTQRARTLGHEHPETVMVRAMLRVCSR